MRFNLSFISSVSQISTPHLAVAFFGRTIPAELAEFDLPKGFVSEIEKKLQDKENTHFAVSTYITHKTVQKITVVFVDEKTNEEGLLAKHLRGLKKDVTLWLPNAGEKQLQDASMVFVLTSYAFTQFVTGKKEERKLVLVADEEQQKSLQKQLPLLNAVWHARDLVNTPSSHKYPALLAEHIQKMPWKNTKITVLDKKQLQKANCNLLLAVGAGSANEPYIVMFERSSTDKTAEKVAVIGK